MKKRLLAIVLSLALLCSALPMVLSVTAVAAPTVTEITTNSDTANLIPAADNILKKAGAKTYESSSESDSIVYTLGDRDYGRTHDGAIDNYYKLSNKAKGSVWIQYDFTKEYAFSSLLMAGSFNKSYGFEGVDVYIGSATAAQLMENSALATPVYSATETIYTGRRVDLPEEQFGRYVVFRLGGRTADGNLGGVWISELAAIGRAADADVVTEIDTGVNENKIIAPEDNVLTKAQSTRYTMGDGWGWGDSATNVVTDPIPSCVYDGVLFGDVFELGDTYAGEVWIEYAFASEYDFDSFLIAGKNDYSWQTIGQGIYGFDVYIGDKSFTDIQNDATITPTYSTTDYVIKGRHVKLAKAATGRYVVIRMEGLGETWCDCCWISELAATGSEAYPDVVTEIDTGVNEDKIIYPINNVLTKAKGFRYTVGDGNGWGSDTETVIVTDPVAAEIYDGELFNTYKAFGDSITGEVWFEYDFEEQYTFDSLLVAGTNLYSWDEKGQGIYGFDVYIGDKTFAEIQSDATAKPTYSTNDSVINGRHVKLGQNATGRYLVFRFKGFNETWCDCCWISELAATGRAVNAASNISAMANVHVPDTGIVNPPVVVQKVTDTLPATNKALPAVAVLDIDAQLNILNGEGEAFATVDEFCQQYSAYVIGAYVVDTAAEVTALTDYLTENGVDDAYVFAAEKDIALATMAWETMPTLRCGIICDTVGADATDWAALCAKVHNDTGVTQVLSLAPVSAQAMTYFNSHVTAVWSVAEDKADVYQAISAGYHAVMANDPALVYDVYTSITTTTVSGRPITIAHRGTNTVNGVAREDAKGENTIDAFVQAYEYGCAGVETDLRITKACDPATCDHGCADHDTCADCQPHIVLHHDWNLDRTTDAETLFGANLTTKDLTMAQLRTLTVDYLSASNGWTGKLCTLEEALATTEDTGLVYFCHINDPEVIDLFNALLEAHPEYIDNCVVFASPSNIQGTFGYDDVTAPLPFLFGDTDENKAYMQGETDSQKVLQYMRKMMNPYSGNPIFYTITYSNFNSNDNFYYQSAARGFMTYHTITDDDIELNKALLIRNGAVGLLTNSMWCARDWHTEIATMDSTISLLPGKALNTTYTVDCIDQYNKDANCGFVQLSGPELIYSQEVGGYVAPDGAIGDAVVVYYYDGTAPGETEAGNATYRIYSAPVTVKLGSAVVEFLGGQIRGEVEADKPTALRFGFSLTCDGVVYKDISKGYDRDITNATIVMGGQEYTLVDFGAIVSIEKGIDITLETAVTNSKVVKTVPAQRLYSVNDDWVKYTAVVTNVPANRKGTLIYARSYMTYKEIGSDQEITVYGDIQSRSVNQVLATTKIG